MSRARIVAAAAVVIAVGLAVGTTATTPPVGQVLGFLLLSTQGEDPGNSTNSATKVSVLNLSTSTCAYTVRFLDKNGVQQCQLTDSLAPGKQTNFSTDDVPDDVYLSGNNCSPTLDDYKGNVEVFVANLSGCRQRTVVDGFRAHWGVGVNACAGACSNNYAACTTDTDCTVDNFCDDTSCAIGGEYCATDDECPDQTGTCDFACEVTGEMCTCDDDCPEVGTPVTADRMTILSIDKYSLKLQNGD